MSSRRTSPYRQRLVYGACAIAIVAGCGAYYRQLWPSYAAFSRAVDPGCMVPYCDFNLYYYKQAQQVRTHDTPVKKYFYTPTFALLIAPIGQLSKTDAFVAWTWVHALSLLLLIVASVMLLWDFPRWLHAMALLLTLTSYPVLNNWKWGQANTTFIALVVLALALSERGFSKLPALAVSLVVASRYYPVSYALAFNQRGRRKTLAWLLLFTGLLLVALPVMAMGFAHARHFYAASFAAIDQATTTWVTTSRSSEYLPTALQRLAANQRWAHAPSRSTWVLIAYALASCNVAAVLWAQHKRIAHQSLWTFCLVALSTPLLLPTSWLHYFVYLPLVQTFIAAQLATLRGWRRLRSAAWLVAWAPSAALSSLFFFQHTEGARSYAQHGFLLISNLTALVLAHLLLQLRCAEAA